MFRSYRFRRFNPYCVGCCYLRATFFIRSHWQQCFNPYCVGCCYLRLDDLKNATDKAERFNPYCVGCCYLSRHRWEKQLTASRFNPYCVGCCYLSRDFANYQQKYNLQHYSQNKYLAFSRCQ